MAKANVFCKLSRIKACVLSLQIRDNLQKTFAFAIFKYFFCLNDLLLSFFVFCLNDLLLSFFVFFYVLFQLIFSSLLCVIKNS